MGLKMGRREPGTGSKTVERLSVRICGIPFSTGIIPFLSPFLLFGIGLHLWPAHLVHGSMLQRPNLAQQPSNRRCTTHRRRDLC
jgi:hypothetical protein